MATTKTVTRRGERVGESMKKLDGVPKTTGEFVYASDLQRPGMLFGATARSRHPHALIKRIDVSKASAMPGVRAVLLADDVPGRKTFGIEVPDQPVLASERVRYTGEPIAIVAAEDRDSAQRAALAVEVQYELLEPIGDPELALVSEPLHEDPPKHPGWRRDGRPNVVRTIVIRHGNPDAQGEVSVSGVYEVGRQDPAFLGPEAGLAIPDEEGGVDIHVATQWLHQDLHQLLACLDLSREQCRIHLAGVGGAFGGREDLSGQIHACMLAMHTGRPVKFMYSRDESFVGHVHRHPAKVWAEHRARRDGTLVCVHMRLLFDGGAYASGSPSVTYNGATMPMGPYNVPNALLEATSVYTNNPPAGAMRGFGVVQSCYVSESQMDLLARELGMDPVELRLKNAMAAGDPLPTGEPAPGPLPTAETIRACMALEAPTAEALPRDPIRLPGGSGNTTRGDGVRRGEGFAVTMKNACYSGGYDDYSAGRLRVYEDGGGELVAEIHSAAVEFGQGITNVLTQVVRTELGIERVELATASTLLDSSGSTSASRQTWMSVGALRMCCQVARELLDAKGGTLPAGEAIDVERVYRHPETSPLDPETGQVVGERSHAGFGVAAMRVIVEVDVDLGLVRIVWAGVAQDVGKAMNPIALEGQIEGGVTQGLGLGVMEEVLTENGIVRNASFTDYLLPTMLDTPPMSIALLEIPNPDAPYGLKGVAEAPTVIAPAAVAAAIRDATGLDLRRIPVRPADIALARREEGV
jgi:CO/xanthine dehydrogenase Mo-binding subunit